jgi:cytochrome c556
MTKLALAAAMFAAVSLPLHAQLKPEDQVKQRRSAFAIIGNNFSNLGAMAQGKKPYNKEEAARNAQLVAALADYPRGFFGEGTDKGDTKARPEIWKNRSDFDAKMDKFVQVARTLPQNVGDEASLKKAVADTGAACKACHDDYRAK